MPVRMSSDPMRVLPLIAFCAVIAGCGYSPTLPKHLGSASNPVAMDQFFVVGETAIRVVRASVADGKLQIDIETENRSAGKILDAPNYGPTVVDNFGNDLRFRGPHNESWRLYPGKSRRDYFEFDAPVRETERLLFSLRMPEKVADVPPPFHSSSNFLTIVIPAVRIETK